MSIPDKFLPKPDVKRHEDEGGGQRRRGSAFRGTGGGERTRGKVQPDADADDDPLQHPAVQRGADPGSQNSTGLSFKEQFAELMKPADRESPR